MKTIQGYFEKQEFMRTLGAELVSCETGRVRLGCAITDALKQQHGYAHAGVLASIADSACGYAALTTMPEGWEVVWVEYKTPLLRPCRGPGVTAEGRVLKRGRTFVSTGGAVPEKKGGEASAAVTATMFCFAPKS